MDGLMEYFEINPARAKAKKPIWDEPEWYAEEKLDGWRFLMHIGKDLERTYMTGRRESKRTGMLSEKGECARPLWPSGYELGYTVLDGEVMPPEGAGFRDIASIMNVEPIKAEQRIAEIGPPLYYAFDILWFNGEDVRGLSYLERKALLNQAFSGINSPNMLILPHWADANEERFNAIIAQGGEGVILKHFAGEYGEDWIKVKRKHTLDVVITGFTDARVGRTGKYVGLIGAAIISVYGSHGQLLEVGQVSGMTDDIRRHMSANKSEWLGTVIEIEASGFAKDRLWHPRYKRHRPDALPRSATLAKMRVDLGMDEQSNPVMAGQQSLF